MGMKGRRSPLKIIALLDRRNQGVNVTPNRNRGNQPAQFGIDLSDSLIVMLAVFLLMLLRIAELRHGFQPSVKCHQLLATVANLPTCVIGMEACGSAHYWGRTFLGLWVGLYGKS